MRRRLRVPSPSMVVALVALFVALVGTAYAASLPRNSVGNSQLKNNAVTSGKVKNSTLTGSDVKNSSVSGADVKDNSLTGSDVKESTLGTVPSATSAASLVGLRYAYVRGNGTVDPARSSGITDANITHPHDGTYCLNGLTGAHTVLATVEASGTHTTIGDSPYSDDFIATARLGAPSTLGFFIGGNCPSTSVGQVDIADPRAGAPGSNAGNDGNYTYVDTDSPFYLIIH